MSPRQSYHNKKIPNERTSRHTRLKIAIHMHEEQHRSLDHQTSIRLFDRQRSSSFHHCDVNACEKTHETRALQHSTTTSRSEHRWRSTLSATLTQDERHQSGTKRSIDLVRPTAPMTVPETILSRHRTRPRLHRCHTVENEPVNDHRHSMSQLEMRQRGVMTHCRGAENERS